MRARAVFLGKFLLLIAVLYTLIALKPVDRAVVSPWTRGVVEASALLLKLGNQGVITDGTVMSSKGFAVDVKNGCNGVEAMLLLISAMVAFPAPPVVFYVAMGLILARGAERPER
jgi:exosortase/archaeosortase